LTGSKHYRVGIACRAEALGRRADWHWLVTHPHAMSETRQSVGDSCSRL